MEREAMDNLVVLEWFGQPHQAEVLRSRLEAEGVESVLARDRYGNSIAPFAIEGGGGWTGPITGVYVLVKPEDTAAATAILREIKAQSSHTHSAPEKSALLWQISLAILVIALLVNQAKELGIYTVWTVGIALLLVVLTIGVNHILFK